MALDFPSAPIINDLYTFGAQTWQWDGLVWAIAGPAPTSGIYVAKSGDTMTGQLSGITPVAAGNFTRKDYVDNADLLRLLLTGGTVSGQINGIAPVAAANLTRRDYVDAQVATRLTQAQGDAAYLQLIGGTVTGQISGITPTLAAHLTRKDYVDGQVALKITQAQGDARYLQLTGGVMTGQITGITPVSASDLARKDYVDTKLALAGGTLTGALLASVGTVALPGIAFAGDTNLGIYRIAADRLGISANGVLELEVSGGGIVVSGTIWSGAGTVALPAYASAADPNTGVFFYPGNVDAFGFATGGVSRLEIDNNGIYCVARLEISQGVASDPGIRFISSANTGLFRIASNQIGFALAGVERARLSNANDNVLTLQTRAFADARYAPIASDARFKTDVAPMPSMLSTVAALTPVTFNWIQPAQGAEGTQELRSPLLQYGMIAQQTAEIVPSSLAGQDESGYGIDPLTMIGILVKAVQELITKVQQLESPHLMNPSIETIAAVAHDANRAWCYRNGDMSQPLWDDAPDWQKASACAGVAFHVDNRDATDSASHDSWLAHKEADGWVYGDFKDPEKKTHPCMVPFEDLPEFQQKKDRLFRSIIHALI